MNKISFRKKMFLSMLLFTIPICVLTFMMFNAQSVNIDFAKREKIGIEFLKPLIKSLVNVSKIQFIQNESKFSDSSIQNLKSKESLIAEGEQLLKELIFQQEKNGSFLEFTEAGLKKRNREKYNIQNLQNYWTEIKSTPSDQAFQNFILCLRTMITHVGDTSNLILDPDLDSYYLMDAAVVGFPQAIERILNSDILIRDLAQKKDFSINDKIQLAVISQMIFESDVTRILADSQTALNEDLNFYGTSENLQSNLPGSIEKYKNSSLNLQKQLLSLDHLEIKKSILKAHELASFALESSSNSNLTSLDELNTLLELRLKQLTFERTTNFIIALIVLIFSCFFSIQLSKEMSSKIFNITKQLSSTGSVLDKSSEELADASKKLSSSTTESAAALEESVASLEEITSMVSANASHTKIVTELSVQAENIVSDGESKMIQLVESMNKISKGSVEIEKIIEVINDIAFQTNLLALNAAVEAARAGDSGRGFAVVADSVRSLAQKSAESSKEITLLIKQNAEMTKSGAELAKGSESVFEKISEKISKISQLNKEISASCNEQSIGIQQISTAVNMLDVKSQSNASSSEDIADSSSTLRDESHSMQEHLFELEVLVKGRSA